MVIVYFIKIKNTIKTKIPNTSLTTKPKLKKPHTKNPPQLRYYAIVSKSLDYIHEGSVFHKKVQVFKTNWLPNVSLAAV